MSFYLVNANFTAPSTLPPFRHVMPQLRLEDLDSVPREDLKKALLAVLKDCPNESCTRKSLVSKIAAGHFGVKTLKGTRRKEFTERLNRLIGYMVKEKSPRIEVYQSTNERVRRIR